MRQNMRTRGSSSEKTVKDIRRATRKQYNHVRPHQALNMRPPVPETLHQTST